MILERGEMVMVAYALFVEELKDADHVGRKPLSPEGVKAFIGYFRIEFPEEHALLMQHSISFEDPEVHEDLEGEQKPIFRVLIREVWNEDSSFIQTYAAPN